MLGLLGMVTLFGGTRFWAAGPFVLVILGIAVAFGILSALQAGKSASGVRYPPDFFWWFGLLGYVGIRAAFFSPIPYETWVEFGFWWIAWMLYAMMADLGNQSKAWTLAAYLLLFGVCFHTCWSIIQHWHGTRMVLWVPRPAQYGMRASSSYICPNHYAHFLMMGIVVAYGCLFTPKARLSLRLFSGFVLIPACGILVLTHSRSGLIGAFVGMSVIALGKAMRRGWKRVVITLLSVAGSCAVIIFLLLHFYPPMRERMVRDIQNNIRISQVWPDTWSMIQAEGIWGAGPGVYAQVFDKYREHFNSASLYLEYAHNEFLQTIAEYGWVGGLYLLGLLLWMSGGWLGRAVKSRSDTAAMIPITMLALLAGSLAHAVFDFNLHIPANALLLVALLGVLYGQGVYVGVWKRKNTLSANSCRVWFWWLGFSSLMLMIFVVRLTVGGWYEYRMQQAIEAGLPAEHYRYAAKMREWTPWYSRGWTHKGFEFRERAVWLLDETDRQKAIDESRTAYLVARDKNPYDKIALSGLVELARLGNDLDEALRLIEELRRLAPYDVQVRIQQGLVLRELGRDAEALQVFADALKMQGAPTKQIQLNIKRLRRRMAQEASS